MNDQLQKALAGNIEFFTQWLKDSVNAMGDFITQETPLFIQEYLTWCFWEALVTAVLALLVVIFAWIGWIVLWKKTAKVIANVDSNCHEPAILCRGISTVVVLVLSGAMLTCGVYQNGMTALKIKVAPRLVLVEKAAELVKDLTGTKDQPYGRR